MPKPLDIGNLRSELGLYCINKFHIISSLRTINAKKLIQLYPNHCWYVYQGTTPSWLRMRFFVNQDSSVLDLDKFRQIKNN